MVGQVTIIRGVVRALEGSQAIVEVEQGGCGRCHEKGGCGGQQITQMFCSGQKTYYVDNPGGAAAVGERVDVAIAAGAVRRMANLAYGLPLIGIVAGAVFGMHVADDAGSMVGGGMGLVLAWLLMQWKAGRGPGNSGIRPYIVPRTPS